MYELNVIKNTINIGLENPVGFLQMSDCHICREDPSGWNRAGTFDVSYKGSTEDYFFKAIDYAKENNLIIIHTGDIIDFYSEGNYKFVDEHFSDVDYIFAAGNHDFFNYADGFNENDEYKRKGLKRFAPHIKSNLLFSSRIVGGVNVVALDDSYCKITEGQIELLKAEAAKGYPILLCMHVPLFGPNTIEKIKNGIMCHDIGIPEEYILKYVPEEKREEMRSDEATMRAVEYIKNEPMIKALITGHHHYNVEENLDTGLVQYITDGTFNACVREITVI